MFFSGILALALIPCSHSSARGHCQVSFPMWPPTSVIGAQRGSPVYLRQFWRADSSRLKRDPGDAHRSSCPCTKLASIRVLLERAQQQNGKFIVRGGWDDVRSRDGMERAENIGESARHGDWAHSATCAAVAVEQLVISIPLGRNTRYVILVDARRSC